MAAPDLATQRRKRRWLLWNTIPLVVLGVFLLAGFVAFPSLLGVFLIQPGLPIYFTALSFLLAAYTAAAYFRNESGPLLSWPVASVLLLALAVFPLASELRSVWLVLLAIGLFFTSGILGIYVTIIVFTRSQVELIHPLHLKGLPGTHPSLEKPHKITIATGQKGILGWARLAHFFRETRLVDLVTVRRQSATIRIGRIRLSGLPMPLMLILLPFGSTKLSVDEQGILTITVDRHVYSLLERPGPYDQYCRNIADILTRARLLISEGRRSEAIEIMS